ncbi:hypothetical protein SPF06_01010 [Sinomonas sp. JGH33]|uniref:Uncharacterized protein n=1 Tax=Sinomonas terricola TaxID=3110330 RepID=A0ABU5T133_9MICC|nr:hypothetical protein [Sinomonas sp. JGH33]MEA5453290.1 hypothetical protein [Sinomonas sp. JGH33]
MGPKGPISVPALLDQLAEAVKPSLGGGTAGSAGIRILIDSKAFGVQKKIGQRARARQAELIPRFAGTVREVIASWAIEPINGEWQEYLTLETAQYIGWIEEVLDPERLYHPNAPCPSCGQQFYGEDRDKTLAVRYLDPETGERLHISQLAMWCQACAAEWAGDEVLAIAQAIANSTK